MRRNKMSSNPDHSIVLDIILIWVPLLIMIAYGGLAVTGISKTIHISPELHATLFGYKFNLSKAALNWFQTTDRGFILIAIPYGLLQLILIVLGFIVDLILHLIFLVINFLWFILIIILWALITIILPAGLPIWSVINLVRTKADKVSFISALVSMPISIICGVGYFIIHLS